MEQASAENSNRNTHDLPGIGEFRAKRGTAVDELAGAANYWYRQFELSERASLKRFRDGFLSGMTFFATITAAVVAVAHFWR